MFRDETHKHVLQATKTKAAHETEEAPYTASNMSNEHTQIQAVCREGLASAVGSPTQMHAAGVVLWSQGRLHQLSC